MDGSRFDELARSLVRAPAGRGSRRRFLGGLAGLAVGLLGVGSAAGQGACPAGQVNRRGLGCVCRATGRPPVNGLCAGCTTAAFTGALAEGDPTFTPCDVGSGSFRYDAVSFDHCGGPLTVSYRGAASGGGALSDPFLDLYAGTFQPGDCSNLIAQNDDGGCGFDALLTFADLAAGRYTAVLESFSGGQGTYTLEINLPPPVCLSTAAEGDKGPRG